VRTRDWLYVYDWKMRLREYASDNSTNERCRWRCQPRGMWNGYCGWEYRTIGINLEAVCLDTEHKSHHAEGIILLDIVH
jgi:hypothetical protein